MNTNLKSLPVYHLKGALDSFTAIDFKKATDHMPLERGSMILDLTDLKYITSAGIAAFVELAKKLDKRNGILCLLNPNEEVRLLFDFFGMTSTIRIADSWKEAESLFKKYLGIDRPGFQIAEGGPVQLSRSVNPIIQRSNSEPDEDIPEIDSMESEDENIRTFESNAKAKPVTARPIVENEKLDYLNNRLTSLSENLNRLNATLEELSRKENSMKHAIPDGGTVEFPASLEEDQIEQTDKPQANSAKPGSEFDRSQEPESDQISSAKETEQKINGETESVKKNQPEPASRTEKPGNSSTSEILTPASHGKLKSFSESRIIRCEQCHSHLRIYQNGRHLCPVCDIEFEVRPDGSASFYEAIFNHN